ncbi:hypothetical protein FQZ97_1016710 [compost metagenome]
MPEANDHFFFSQPFQDIGFGFFRREITALNIKCHFVSPAVLRPAQRTDSAGNGRINIGACTGNYPAGEGGSIKLVFGIQVQRDLHGFYPGC